MAEDYCFGIVRQVFGGIRYPSLPANISKNCRMEINRISCTYVPGIPIPACKLLSLFTTATPEYMLHYHSNRDNVKQNLARINSFLSPQSCISSDSSWGDMRPRGTNSVRCSRYFGAFFCRSRESVFK